MRRIALLTEYDGSIFHGWQRQENAFTVQEALEICWRELTGEPCHITGCSRTDTGVSARAHVSHLDTDTKITTEKLHLAMNTKLKPGLQVLAARDVGEDFHARFSARGKSYSYRLLTGRVRPAIERNHLSWLPATLDFAAMREASAHIVGEHDFVAFMDQGTEVKTTVRHIYECNLTEKPASPITRSRLYELNITGDGFLYHMVRIIVGTLVAVGKGKIRASDLPALLAAGDRTVMGSTMTAEGLTLERVYYGEELFAADRWVY